MRTIVLALMQVALCQVLFPDGSLLILNSSLSQLNILSVSLTYNGTSQLSLVFMDKFNFSLVPGSQKFVFLHPDNIEINTFINSKDGDQYWLSFKTPNQFGSPFKQYLPISVNGIRLLMPTVNSVLHLLGLPLRAYQGQEPSNPDKSVLLFQVNYNQRSLVAVAKFYSTRVKIHWGADYESADTIHISASKAIPITWNPDNNEWMEFDGHTKWGKGWLVQTKDFEYAKVVRQIPSDQTDEPEVIAVSLNSYVWRFIADHRQLKQTTAGIQSIEQYIKRFQDIQKSASQDL